MERTRTNLARRRGGASRPGTLMTVLAALLLGAVSLGAPAATTVYYVHTDHLGTPKALTDQNAQVVWRADHTPFGTALETVTAVQNRVRFPGQYFDGETGLHYNYFRDYDPVTGRYIQSDPIGLEGGLNTYAYVDSNPVVRKDPMGLHFDPNMNFSYPEDMLQNMFEYYFGPDGNFLERVATEVGHNIACTARCFIIGEVQGAAAEMTLDVTAKRIANQGVRRVLNEGIHLFKLANKAMGPVTAFKCALDCTESTSCIMP